jgi:3-hydroxybutyryl-CoA dehydrogenase
MGADEALPPDAVIGVIGVGTMGAGIAQVAAQAGHRVRVFDTRIGAAEAAVRQIADVLRGLVAKGRLESAAAEAAVARLSAVHALGDFVSARLVVEAIVEDLAAKRNLMRELEVVAPPDTILATNTSSLSITAISAGMKHPERVAGMHFFNPVPLMPLVEVVRGHATNAAVAATVHATALAWGKTPVHTASTPGFIVNRCARPFYGEALRLLNERAGDPATLDAVMRECGGFRMGPFELMDLVGLDVNLAVTRSVWEAYFQDPRYAPSVIQQELVSAGYLGRKSGRGFYDYAANAQKPMPSTESEQPAPRGVSVVGDPGAARALVGRMAAGGAKVDEAGLDARFPAGALRVGSAWLVATDGRTATGVARAAGESNVVVFDLALDYATCKRVAIAAADTSDPATVAGVVGALQLAGVAVTRLDDVAGLAVMRTVAMLANEAADAVTQGIGRARDVDLAMEKGVNYPRGPLAWAQAIGTERIREVLANLAAHYGEDRYRLSPLIARRCASRQPLHEGPA